MFIYITYNFIVTHIFYVAERCKNSVQSTKSVIQEMFNNTVTVELKIVFIQLKDRWFVGHSDNVYIFGEDICAVEIILLHYSLSYTNSFEKCSTKSSTGLYGWC